MTKCNGPCYIVGNSPEYCARHAKDIQRWDAIKDRVSNLTDSDAAALCRYLGGYLRNNAEAARAFEAGLRNYQPSQEEIKREAHELYCADVRMAKAAKFTSADTIIAHGLGVKL